LSVPTYREQENAASAAPISPPLLIDDDKRGMVRDLDLEYADNDGWPLTAD